ncbi:pyridoxamine 5'-phosphate oxidase family protein [Candidatus Pacebacteria bacterium]|nr:pyridoxamine 5'-phosphate oxidase family protein [Candidatus Paceibacterota bacterium]
MEKNDLKKVAEAMKEIDFCMMTTVNGNGTMHSRPMSNNKDVEYDGDSYFFTCADTDKVSDIETTPRTSLAYQGGDMWFIEVYGESSITDDREAMEPYWQENFSRWFKDGLDTDGLRMIKVSAKRISYWNKEEHGKIELE